MGNVSSVSGCTDSHGPGRACWVVILEVFPIVFIFPPLINVDGVVEIYNWVKGFHGFVGEVECVFLKSGGQSGMC